MATGGNAGDAPFMKQAPLPSREGKFYASEGCNSSLKILPGGVFPEIHPSKGNVGDAPGMKQSPVEGKLHTIQIWASPATYTGGDPKTLPGGDRPRALSGDHPEAISGCDHPEAISGGGHPDTLTGIDHPTTLASVGPTIKSGGLMLAGGDPMVAAGYFSKIYTMAVKPPVLFHVPRTVESLVRLESPRDPRITILFRDFARRASASKRQNLKALQVKREDRSERKKLEEERLEFEEEKKQAFLSLEEERKQFEEYKKQFPQEAVVEEEEKKKAVAVEEEKKGTMLSTTVSKINKADSNISAISGGGHPDTLSGRGRPDTLAGNDHPTTLAGVGPTIKSGGLMLAGGDPMVAAGYFSKIYTMAVKPPVLIHVPRTEPIVLQSPRDNVGINQLRNFIKRTILRRLVERERLVNKRERLVEKREDRAERHEQRVEKREIRADEKGTANHATALGLEQERKKIQEDKEQHSLSLQQDRKKFDEDQKAAIVALEEEGRKLEEHKVKVSQRAAEQGQGEEPKGQAAKGQDKGQSALIVSKVETADSRLGLVEKLIDIPKRKQAIMKSIRENVDIVKNAPIVKKYVTPHTKRIQRTITATTTTGVLGYLRVEIRDFLGFPAGVSNGGPKNGTGHEAASTGAGTGHEAASASTGAGTGHEAASASTGAGTGHEAASASTGAGAGNEAASASTGAGAGNEAASTGAGSGVKVV